MHFRKADGYIGKRYSFGEPFVSPMISTASVAAPVTALASTSRPVYAGGTSDKSQAVGSWKPSTPVDALASGVSSFTPFDTFDPWDETPRYFAVARGPARAVYFDEKDAQAAIAPHKGAVMAGFPRLEAAAHYAQKYECYHYTRKGC